MRLNRSAAGLAVVTISVGLAVVPVASAAVHHVLDWESASQQGIPNQPPPGWEAQYNKDLVNPSGRRQLSLARAPEPVRAGTSSARFELDRKTPGSVGGPRTELAGDVLDGERWYGFSIYLPESWTRDRAAEIVTQWHHTGDTGSPPLAIETDDGQWQISQNWEDSERDTSIGAYQVGRWTDWVVHVRWSAGGDGLLQIWRDGVPVPGFERKVGRNSYDDPATYMKIGIYKWPWGQGQQSDTTNRVMYHDELRIADSSGSYEQVAPGTGQPPPPSGGYPVAEVTASSDDGNVPANTLDDNPSTRWSAHGDGESIRYDLGSAKKVTALGIAWHLGDQRTSRFDVETSDNGTAWTPAATGLTSHRTLAQDTYDIPDVVARYVRIVGHGNSSGNGWNSITEVDILGPGDPGCAMKEIMAR